MRNQSGRTNGMTKHDYHSSIDKLLEFAHSTLLRIMNTSVMEGQHSEIEMEKTARIAEMLSMLVVKGLVSDNSCKNKLDTTANEAFKKV